MPTVQTLAVWLRNQIVSFRVVNPSIRLLKAGYQKRLRLSSLFFQIIEVSCRYLIPFSACFLHLQVKCRQRLKPLKRLNYLFFLYAITVPFPYSLCNVVRYDISCLISMKGKASKISFHIGIPIAYASALPLSLTIITNWFGKHYAIAQVVP